MEGFSEPVRTELAALTRRFSATVSERHVSVVIIPSGHCPVPLPRLDVSCELPLEYPAVPAVPHVLSSAFLPASIAAALNLIIARFVNDAAAWRGQPMLRHCFRWLEGHVDELLTQIIALQQEAVRGGGEDGDALHHRSTTRTEGGHGSSLPPATRTVTAAEAPTTASARAPAALSPRTIPPTRERSGMDDWTVDEHVRFEAAVREYFFERGRAWADGSAWRCVAECVNVGGGVAVTAAQCLARHLALQHVVKEWEAHCVAPFRSDVSERPVPPVVAPTAPTPDSDPSEAAVLTSQRDQRDASTQQGDRSAKRGLMAQPRGDHSRAMHKVPFPERPRDGEEEEDDGDRRNPRHVRLFKFFSKAGGGVLNPEEDEEAEGADGDEEGQDEEGEAAGGGQGGRAVEGEREGEEEEEEGGDDEDEEEDEVDDSHVAAFTGVHLDPDHKGYQVSLERFTLYGIGTCAATRAHITVQCMRCALVLTADVAGAQLQWHGQEAPPAVREESAAGGGSGGGGGGGSSSKPTLSAAKTEGTSWTCWCPKCSLLLSIHQRPTLLHEGSAVMSYVDASQAVVTGLAAMWLAATCLECGAPVESPKLSPPVTWEASCHHCYSRVRLEAKGTDIQLASAENAERAGLMSAFAASARGRGGANKRDPRVTPGNPLPEEGTCRHYRQSYRWLRFPCCDQTFPCDACHDEKADHSAEWAKRMICGHCAREQPFTNAPCVACGGSMRRSTKHAKFWEGGEGQRNRAHMSRKDQRKFGDSTHKTRSMKSERVGAAGAAARDNPKPKGKVFERYHFKHGEAAEVQTVVVKKKTPKKFG